ncbi:pectinesterase family protein [Granulicella sp. 5B5]|uniref:pectinesterase family protein n=1 Tax=Granulicella sp. 5B5 TaxID=1617967 RepID=UPI0015F35B1F|nr:pectinesterase family protein [Granulicella sp. 5B5]
MRFRECVVRRMAVMAGVAVVCTVAYAERPVVSVPRDFKTVQAAVDAAPAGGSIILIAPGVYREKLHITTNGIELKGTGKSPEKVVLTWDDGARYVGGTKNSGSVNVTADDFTAENLTIQNDFERTHDRSEEGSQAVALMMTGDREVLRHVRLLGYQDTLYANSKTCHNSSDATDKPCHASRQLFEDCYIEGHIDFIFGDAKAVFDHCEIHAVAHQIVTITAQSRLYPEEDSGYLFLHTTITEAKGVGQMYFGRPWRPYSRVYFVDTVLKDAAITPVGWLEWGGRLKTSDYAEYGTVDAEGKPVDVGERVSTSRQLTSDEAKGLSVETWLTGTDGWNPASVQ